VSSSDSKSGGGRSGTGRRCEPNGSTSGASCSPGGAVSGTSSGEGGDVTIGVEEVIKGEFGHRAWWRILLVVVSVKHWDVQLEGRDGGWEGR
jgi:hypothetical protein